MKKTLIILVLMAVLGFAVEGTPIRPDIAEPTRFFTVDTIPPQDTIYSSWVQRLHEYSEGTFTWAQSGSGAIDSVRYEIQHCFWSTWSHGLYVIDSTYLTPWDTLHTVISDTIYYYPLNQMQPYGWFPIDDGWVRIRGINFDASDSAFIYHADLHRAGSK